MVKMRFRSIYKVSYIIFISLVAMAGMTLAALTMDNWAGPAVPGGTLTVGQMNDLYDSMKTIVDNMHEVGGAIGIGAAPDAGLTLDVNGQVGATHICAADGTNCRDLSLPWNSMTYAQYGGCVGDDEVLLVRQIANTCLGGSQVYTYDCGREMDQTCTRTCHGTDCTAGTNTDWQTTAPVTATCTYETPRFSFNTCSNTDQICSSREYYLCKAS